MSVKGSAAAAIKAAIRDAGASQTPAAQLRSPLGGSEAFLQHGRNMPAVVFAKDSATGRFVLLNRAGEEFLGVPRAAIIGKTDHDFFPKEEADRFIARDPPRAPVAPAASGRGGAGPYPA